MMSKCLFCRSNGRFSTDEHIIPESLGNDDLILREEVCDSCQAYFGQKLEEFILSKTPIGFWRVWLRIRTKKGKPPFVNLSQPSKNKGRFQDRHCHHDDISFMCHADGTRSVWCSDKIAREIANGERKRLIYAWTPKKVCMFGRFFCKVGIELLCASDPIRARSEALLEARNYARFGKLKDLWPVFHFTKGNINDFQRIVSYGDVIREQIDCYSYSLFDFLGAFLLFRFAIGTDNWVISLNHPYPLPFIKDAFPDSQIKPLWAAPTLSLRGQKAFRK